MKKKKKRDAILNFNQTLNFILVGIWLDFIQMHKFASKPVFSHLGLSSFNHMVVAFVIGIIISHDQSFNQ